MMESLRHSLEITSPYTIRECSIRRGYIHAYVWEGMSHQQQVDRTRCSESLHHGVMSPFCGHAIALVLRFGYRSAG